MATALVAFWLIMSALNIALLNKLFRSSCWNQLEWMWAIGFMALGPVGTILILVMMVLT